MEVGQVAQLGGDRPAELVVAEIEVREAEAGQVA